MKTRFLFVMVILGIFIAYSNEMYPSAHYSYYQSTGCTLPFLTYGPYIQPDDPELDSWRERLFIAKDNDVKKILDENPNITCIKIFKPEKSLQCKCFQYAIQKITGFDGYIELPREGKISIDLNKYFVQVKSPKKNSLLIYTTSQTDLAVHHFGVAIDELWCESKSGARLQVTKHLHFHIVSIYGKAMWVFNLRPQYQNNKELLLQEIASDLQKAA